ncbi:MAG: hypothetical protein V4617_19870 [Gemmatimonadota bacterium]
MRSLILPLVALQLLFAGACTPYTVHSSARPLAQGESRRTSMFFVVPGGAKFESDSGGGSASAALPGYDIEQRYGLDDRSDVGLRITTVSGAIVSYKRRLDGPSDKDSRATALMLGGGFVNLGQHAHFEATLITSGREGRSFTPYGGIRALQVVRMSTDVPNDKPTLGGFGGVRFGDNAAGISLELGVFYDRSALGLRRNDVVIVPSVSFSGGALRRMVGR